MHFSQAWQDGNRSITTRRFGIFVFTGQLPKPWYEDESAFFSNISGTISLQTGRAQFRKPIEKLIRKLIRGRDGCAQAGPISFPSSKRPKILPNSPKRNWRCRCSRLVAKNR